MSAQFALATSVVSDNDYESLGVTFAGKFASKTDKPLNPEFRRSPINDEDVNTSAALISRPITLPAHKDIGHLELKELAEWSGCVTGIDTDVEYFTATLKGIKGIGVEGQEEDANIPISDVAQWDRELLREGNFFRLCVVQVLDGSGDPIRATKVVFRRMPSYRQQDLDRALKRGRMLAGRLRVE